MDARTNTTSLTPDAGGATLVGGGVLVLDSPLAELGADSRSLINSNGHTVFGAGTLVSIITNDGVIDANSNGDALIVGESGRKTLGPSGVYRASLGGILEVRKRINHEPDDPVGGLWADGGTIRLRHPKGDAIIVRCASADVSSNGVVELADASRLELTGALTLTGQGKYRGTAGSSAALVCERVDVLSGDCEFVLTGEMSADVAETMRAMGRGVGCRAGEPSAISRQPSAEIVSIGTTHDSPLTSHAARSQRERGCLPPVRFLDESIGQLGSLEISDEGGVEAAGGASLRVGGPTTIDSGGSLLVNESATVEVDGDLVMRLPGSGCPGLSRSETTQSRSETAPTHHSPITTHAAHSQSERGCSPPVLHVVGLGTLDLNGSLRLEETTEVLVGASSNVSLAGDFENRTTAPLSFHWESGPLTMDGLLQNIEAAGRDLGADPAGLIDNFAVGTLSLAGGATVQVVDAFDNQQDGVTACDEAIYVNTLVVSAGATLHTAGCKVYYNTLANYGSIPFLGTYVIGMAGPDGDNDGVPDSSDACPGFNDFADCDADGTPDGCDSEPDCNANGTPDACENAAPCARIVGATSWRTHGGAVGRDEIVINPAGRVGIGGVTSEPRIGGLTELRIAFDIAPGGPGTGPVFIEERTCGDTGGYAPYSGTASAAGSIDGLELVLTFTPSLQNARTYRFTLSPDISALPAQIIEVRCLAGDVDSNGRVNAVDRAAVVGVWTSPAGYSAATDLNLDGRTNAPDVSNVVGAWTGVGTNCAP